MTPIFISQTTIDETKEALFPEMKHTNLASHAVNYLFHNPSKAKDVQTLHDFILFLKSKNYN